MSRRILLTPAALVAALLLAAPALAADPTSNVTSPASPFQPFIDTNLPGTDPSRLFTVAGTTNMPEVDLKCAFREPNGVVVTNALAGSPTPVSGGSFSQSLPIPGGRACRIVALPTAGGTPSDLGPFTGPRYFGAERQAYTIGGIGPNADVVKDVFVSSAAPTLYADTESIAGGGAPYDMAPIDDSGDLPLYAEYLWYANAALYGTSSKPGETRSQLQVDGVNAFAPAAAHELWSGADTASGLPGIKVESVDLDPVTRDVTHVTTEPFVTCPTGGGANITDAAASAANCGSFQPSGVAVQRTVVIRPATRSVETKDRWVSTDGRAHEIDALYDQSQNDGPGVNGYRFPWVDGTAFSAHAAGDVVPAPPGRVTSLFARSKLTSPDDDERYTQGSLTLAPRPDLIRFTSDSRFEVGYRRTVPATGALGVEQRYTVGTKRAAVEALAATMEQRANAGLAVAITSATQVSGYDPAFTVSGATATPGGVRSLVVNGAAVTTKADGTWSTTIQLAPGANALSATVTDNAGDSASTSGTVTFTPGPSQATVLSAGVRKGVLSALLRCQTVPGATCKGKVKLTARVTRTKKTRRGKRKSTKTITLASRSYSVPRGDRAIRTVRLGRANRKLVRKYRIKRGTLTLTQTVGGITKTTKTSVPVRL